MQVEYGHIRLQAKVNNRSVPETLGVQRRGDLGGFRQESNLILDYNSEY
jgi:hypothetical protein